MTRYIENLNECTAPTSGDYLWIVDASAGSTDKDRKVNVSNFGLVSSGTWTPAISGTGSSPTPTYSSLRYGYYMTIGGLTYISFAVETTAISGGSGDLIITGIPTAATLTGTINSGLLVCLLDWSSSKTMVFGGILSGANYIYIYQLQDNATPLVMPVSAWPATGYVQGSILYRTA